jgi:hypothetical protein
MVNKPDFQEIKHRDKRVNVINKITGKKILTGIYHSYPSNYEGERIYIIMLEGNHTNTVNMELQRGDLISFEAKTHTIQPVKRFNIMYNVGKVKYLVSYHKDDSKYSDGSDFFNIASFKNKVKLNDFIKKLEKEGYIEYNY